MIKKMKKINIIISAFFVMLCTTNNIDAQNNRTLETKVADILAQLPTKNLEHSDKLMEEIIGLNSEGVLQFCDMLVPLGTGDDTQARYAIESVARYSGGRERTIGTSVVEEALLRALDKMANTEIKTFLMAGLMHCGSDASVHVLSAYLGEDKLYKPALAVLMSIGTLKASKAVYEATKKADTEKQPTFIEALGKLNYNPSVGLLEQLAVDNSILIRQKSLMALAEIADEGSKEVLVDAVKKAEYNLDRSKAILAYIHYGNRLNETGNVLVGAEVGKTLLKNCTSEAQLHFRSAAVQLLRAIYGDSFTKTLVKEAKHKNNEYRGAVLNAASHGLMVNEVSKWVKAYKKMPVEGKPQLIRMLSKRKEAVVFEKCILVAIKDNDINVKVAGIKALAFQDKKKALPVLLKALKQATLPKEYNAIKVTLLRVCDVGDSNVLANSMSEMMDGGKEVLVSVLAARSATSKFDEVVALLKNGNDDLNSTIYAALSSLAPTTELSTIIRLINSAQNPTDIANVQKAAIHVLGNSKEDNSRVVIDAYNAMDQKGKILPILPALNSDESLKLVVKSLNLGSAKEKMVALNALANWRNNDALPYLFEKASTSLENKIRSSAFKYYLSQVGKSSYPDDQKLLLIKKLIPFKTGLSDQKEIIKSASSIKTFLSLVFVSEYLDTKGLITTASNAAIKIALPTPGKKNELSGNLVREIVSKSISNLTGPDSQYIKIDVKEFLDNMSNEKGFISIFNGKDFTGWEGLVENPIARGKMSKRIMTRAQAKANKQMMEDWFIKDGIIGFKGEGYNNISTVKDYGDFELLVDWKITKGGDSGIYLRGTPQVQIWDVALINVGAQVGSGGLYNNQRNISSPLKVADNPVNEWNTFRIKMVGERVTVHLNGVLVTDNAILENYWDSKSAIFVKEAIELQAHGEDLGFRNIFIREIDSGDVLLSDEERVAGFKSLFNGKDLNHWTGNKTDYLVEENKLVVRPEEGGHGNLYTVEEYSDFIFRFDFKLTPGANNGLGIHTPLEGDAAYVAKELQILDDTAPIYANLKPYQYHGSVYGIMPAKRGFLKAVGEWNSEEVIVKGDYIKIVLNGSVIIEGNMKEASKQGTLDHKDHPGLLKNNGHIAFLGHGSELDFRNIRIKRLK
ncbi:MAG: hypothetical protein COA50_12310 [Flavobacteriaceae bacterium]|nr:MAG: hypothetical protein COA50_12310 [Flavobacteriaceae bacterium]